MYRYMRVLEREGAWFTFKRFRGSKRSLSHDRQATDTARKSEPGIHYPRRVVVLPWQVIYGKKVVYDITE